MTHAAQNLAQLLDGIVAAPLADSEKQVSITDITLDSRAAAQGGLFMACRGIKSHGLDYVARAVDAGVTSVLWEPAPGVSAPQLPQGILALAVPELSRRAGAIADRFFGGPSRDLRIAGITGTNGKTTCAYLLAQALERAGKSAAYMGTVGYGKFGALKTSEHTTADVVTVHRRLAELRDAGIECVAMEVSSHALDQNRVDAVRFDTAVFTNLTHDHLDYHGTLGAYGAAKAKLFGWSGLKAGVVNIDDVFGCELASRRDPRTAMTTYGRQAGATLCALEVRLQSCGVEIEFDGHWGRGKLRSRLLGEFNAENLLAVLAVLLGWEVPVGKATEVLEQCVAPPGRLEAFGAEGKALAVVDYAHTPDALGKALNTLRRHCEGKLWCVFGCGGDRDPHKRPLMGGIAARIADEIVLTDDNPRTEDPADIVAAIVSGMPRNKQPLIIRDRARAIEAAIASARVSDVVLIAGKGHEDYQIYGREARPFSDRAVVAGLMGAHA